MGRGLGKIQRKILEILKTKEKETTCWLLGQYVFDCVDEVGDPIRLKGGEWWQNKEPTKSQWQSLFRSLRRLNKLGIVEIKKHKFTGRINDRPYRDREKRGGQSYYKTVKCLVHGITSNELNTYLKCEVSV